jgi:hypothetical protein
MELADLQSIIDQRATDRLNKDIDSIYKVLSTNWRLFDKVTIFIKNDEAVGGYKPTTLASILGGSTGFTVRPVVFETNIEKYKAEEAATFVKKVDEVHQQVEELFEITSNLENR